MPAITRMNSAVNTTSMMITAPRSKPPGECEPKPFDAPANSVFVVCLCSVNVPLDSKIPQRMNDPSAAPRI